MSEKLSRQRILSAALALVDEQGADALSMRNLGTALGVEAMSLYYYVANRDDLLDGLAETMVATGLPPPTDDQSWEDTVRAFANGIRRTGLTHPAAFQLVGLRPLRSDAALASITALLQKLNHAGFTPTDAVALYRLTAAYARGFVLAEIAGLTLAPPSGQASPPTATTLRPFRRALTAKPDGTFRNGLDFIVQGAAQRRPNASVRRP